MLALHHTGKDSPPVLRTVARPELAPGYVLVKIMAAAITPSDILNAEGGFGPIADSKILGRDFAGIVQEGPSEQLGKAVFGTGGKTLGFTADGTHAEYCVVPLDGVVLKPERLSFCQAAMIGVPFATASLILRRVQVKQGDDVLVIGSSGSVGSALCQLASYTQCRVIRAARHGDVEVNLTSDPDMSSVKEFTNGKGVQAAIDTTGSPQLMQAALRSLATDGKLAYISAPRHGSTTFEIDLLDGYRMQKSLIGCNSVSDEPVETAKDLELVLSAFGSNKLQLPAETSAEKISISEAVDAYMSMMRGEAKEKFVIVF